MSVEHVIIAVRVCVVGAAPAAVRLTADAAEPVDPDAGGAEAKSENENCSGVCDC